MKKLRFLVICVFFLVFSSVSSSTQIYDQGQVVGHGRCPEFISPDTIAFIDNSGFLTLVDSEGKAPQKIGKIHALGFRYTGDKFIFWSYQKGDDGSTVYTISTIDRTGKESLVASVRKTIGPGKTENISAPVVLPDGTIGYWTYEGGMESFTIIHKGTSPNPLKQWIGDIKQTDRRVSYGEIWVRTVDGLDSEKISPEGEKYYFPRMSFDGTQQCGQRLLAVKTDGNLRVLEYDSTGTLDSLWQLGDSNELIGEDMVIDGVTYEVVLGATVASSARWSPDCKWVVCLFQLAGAKYNEDDFNIVGSDVQVLSAAGSVNIKIETPGVMESNASISSNGTVVCQSEKGEIILYKGSDAK